MEILRHVEYLGLHNCPYHSGSRYPYYPWGYPSYRVLDRNQKDHKLIAIHPNRPKKDQPRQLQPGLFPRLVHVSLVVDGVDVYTDLRSVRNLDSCSKSSVVVVQLVVSRAISWAVYSLGHDSPCVNVPVCGSGSIYVVPSVLIFVPWILGLSFAVVSVP